MHWRWKFRLCLGAFIALYTAVLLTLHSGLDEAQNDGAKPSTHLTLASSRLDETSNSSYQVDPTDLWEQPSVLLPAWMTDYFRWHKQQRFTPPTTTTRYLVVTCLSYYRNCGGFADRLSSLPFLIRVAAQHQRLLLIRWGRPAALEDFVLPPVGGLDWRVPEHLWRQELESKCEFRAGQDKILETVASATEVVCVKFQSHDHGAAYYDEHLLPSEPTFAEVLRDCWRILFTPVPPIQQRIQTYMHDNGLEPNQYAASHLRALYGVAQRDERLVEYMTQHAINCTSHQVHHKPVLFFASDSVHANSIAAEYGAEHGLLVVSPQRAEQPLHMDKAKDWKHRDASDFYDTLVDLYLLSLARCVTYGMGGYGKLASLLSYNASCSRQHRIPQQTSDRCLFQRPQSSSSSHRVETAVGEEPLFAPPMPSLDEVAYESVNGQQNSTRVLKTAVLSSEGVEDPLFPDISLLTNASLSKAPTTALWEHSTRLPQWMKDYFAWHAQQLKLVSAENWKEFKYLVMVCLKSSPVCGGTADRLRPLPFIVRVAAETRRILWITWEKPAPLEEFLLPPVGGVDWRTPDWFRHKLDANMERALSVKKLVRFAHDPSNRIVKARVQASDHGSKYYNDQGQKVGEPWDALRQHYRDCWFSFFTPVPAIALIIESEMLRMHLLPGQFSFAHLRAQYGIEERGRDPSLVRNWTINSLNCLSQLRPGGPFFFSSDSSFARQVALEYGKDRNVSIVTRREDRDPLHLDIAQTDSSDPSAYYATFVDLYLMSFGECMSYNMGGFGKWGLLLSGRNFTCNIRHWTAGVPKRTADKLGCRWKDPSRRDPAVTKRTPLRLPLFLPPMVNVEA